MVVQIICRFIRVVFEAIIVNSDFRSYNSCRINNNCRLFYLNLIYMTSHHDNYSKLWGMNLG